MTTTGLTVLLELAAGETIEAPLDFTAELTVDEQAQLGRLFFTHLGEPSLQGAAAVFCRLGRPDDDFEIVGPVLAGFLDGDDQLLTITREE